MCDKKDLLVIKLNIDNIIKPPCYDTNSTLFITTSNIDKQKNLLDGNYYIIKFSLPAKVSKLVHTDSNIVKYYKEHEV